MNLDAWQTVWICVVLSVLVLLVDCVLAGRAGPNKTELVRKGQRGNRLARTIKEKSE